MRIQKVTPRTARRVALQCVTLTQPNLNQALFRGGARQRLSAKPSGVGTCVPNFPAE